MKLSLCIDDRLAFILEDTQFAPETLVAVLMGGCALGD
jgi:hypoxanthine phosphoribosyltransferase